MNDAQKTRESARQSFEASRTAMGTMARTAGLWSAALLIIWLTGLEPTLQVVRQASQSFIAINSGRQYANLRLSNRKRQLIIETQELETLTRFSNDHPTQEKREQKFKQLQLIYLNKDKEAKIARQYDKDEAQRVVDPAKNQFETFKLNLAKLASFSLAERRTKVNTLRRALEEEGGELKKTYLEAKEKAQKIDRNVGFKLLAIEFKSPLLLAPLLWCLFCVGVFVYWSGLRAESVQAALAGMQALFRLPCFATDRISSVAGRLPLWTMKPLLANIARIQAKDYQRLKKEVWIEKMYGSSNDHIVSDLSLFLIPVLFWIGLARVSWIELYLARSLGPDWARAMIPLVIIIALSTLILASRSWLKGEHLIRVLHNKQTVFLTILVIVGAVVSMLTYSLLAGIWMGDVILLFLPWASGIFLLSQLDLYRSFPAHRGFKAAVVQPSKGTSLPTRKKFIFFVSLAGIGFFLPRWLSKQKPLWHQHREFLPPAPGFYRRVLTHKGKKDGKLRTSRRMVYHYIGTNGATSKRWELRKIPGQLDPYRRASLEKVDPPRLLDVVDQQPLKHGSAFGKLQPPTAIPLQPIGTLGSPVEQRSPSLSSKIGTSPAPTPRVHLAAASWSFEQAAIALLQPDRIDSHQAKQACLLLLCGIQHDLVYKERSNNSRKKANPSLRLYDLLAGLCVRFRQDDVLVRLLELIAASEYQSILEPRVLKWQNVTGSWHQRWRNRSRLIKWDGGLDPVVF